MSALLDGEKMAAVAGFEGLYSVTSFGRVWACPKSWTGGLGIKRSHDGKWMRLATDSYGYLVVGFNAAGRKKMVKVARLVAAAFIANPESLPQVNHLDGNKKNNHVSNLEWVTNGGNQTHAWKLGLRTFTEANRRAALIAVKKSQPLAAAAMRKLTATQVIEIRRKYAQANTSTLKLGREYGVGKTTIASIVNNQTYRHVGG